YPPSLRSVRYSTVACAPAPLPERHYVPSRQKNVGGSASTGGNDMARKIKTTKTAEQRRAEADELHGTIAAEVEALRDTDAWQQFLTFAQVFHSYSLNNVMLILSQRPTATQVAGFRKWQELGRQVRKG